MMSCLCCWLLKVKLKSSFTFSDLESFGLKFILDIVCVFFIIYTLMACNHIRFPPCYIASVVLCFGGSKEKMSFIFYFMSVFH